MKNRNRVLGALLQRLDRLALEQLRQEAARLAEENEQLYWAEDSAEAWRRDALAMQDDLCATSGGAPGLTIDGRLVVVSA